MSAILDAHFSIFLRSFGAYWLTLHPPRAVVLRPRQTRKDTKYIYSVGF